MARFRYVAPKRTSMDKIRGLLKAFEFEILVLAFMALFYFFSMYLLYVSARNDGRARWRCGDLVRQAGGRTHRDSVT